VKKLAFPSYCIAKVTNELEIKPDNHFGEASKKIQSLLFMLRENEDVYTLFSRKAHKMLNLMNEGFVETLANMIFNDLTRSQSEKKLAVIVRQWIREEVAEDRTEKLGTGLCSKIFKIFTERGETRKYIDYLFKMKYERIDFTYLDIKDIHALF